MFSSAPLAAATPRRNTRTRRLVAVAALVAAYLGCTAIEAYAQFCKPRRLRPPITLTTLGPCEFDPETFSFAGEPEQQARCLLRSADRTRNLGPHLDSIPAALASRAGQPTGLPERDALAAHLTELNLVWDYAPFLWEPISRARDNDPDAPQARYMVIHDTSAPNFGGRPFPFNIDEHYGINNLGRYRCQDGWGPAHVFINRTGAMLLAHELSEPWRAMKFERGSRFGSDLKGLFLHVELIQPRRSAPGRGHRNDAVAPTPGFSDLQYDRLALIYTIASVRSGRWLIPAFHAAIDAGIRGGHDDPQNFDLDVFAASIDRLVERLMHAPAAIASITPQVGIVAKPVPITAPAATPAPAVAPTPAVAPIAETLAPVPINATAASAPAAQKRIIRRANVVPTRTFRPKRAWKAHRYVRPWRRSTRLARR